jgi:hypothetical protein
MLGVNGGMRMLQLSRMLSRVEVTQIRPDPDRLISFTTPDGGSLYTSEPRFFIECLREPNVQTCSVPIQMLQYTQDTPLILCHITTTATGRRSHRRSETQTCGRHSFRREKEQKEER